jgi:hypothetical protein
MRRREFIGLLGGAPAWPVVGRAQQGERARRIGVLISAVEGDPRGLENITAFAQGLAELGWTARADARAMQPRIPPASATGRGRLPCW